jgi:hypothetical protein
MDEAGKHLILFTEAPINECWWGFYFLLITMPI